jgi:hypothetical protein
MIKLLFKEQALTDLQRFIRQYEEAFFELYSDTGLWNEELIIQSYRESGHKLYLSILRDIELRLKPTKVLGRRTTKALHELLFYVGTRLVIVNYFEDNRRKIRSIESISIDRKPIIF